MQHILASIVEQAEEYEQSPFFAFLQDTSIEPRKRLAFVPAVAHFVMSFADLYALVLREEPAKDELQELVNAHTYEDGDHWRWYLADLEKLGLDHSMPFSLALRLLWSNATRQTRLLTYGMCRLGLGATSLQKLVLVQCIEAAGSVSLRIIARVAREITARTGDKLVYFGSHHFDTEAKHTLEDDQVRARIGAIQIAPAVRQELGSLVGESFRLFNACAGELFTHVAAQRGGLGKATGGDHDRA